MGQRAQWQVANEAFGGKRDLMRSHVWRLVLAVSCLLVVDSVAVGALESTAATAIDTPIEFDIVALHAEQGETIDPLSLEEVLFTTDATLDFDTVAGTITYIPEPAFVGVDSFEYTACDTTGSCDTHLIAVEVFEPVAPTPEDDDEEDDEEDDDASASTTIPLVEGIELPEALPPHLQPTTTTVAPVVSPATTTTVPAQRSTTTSSAPATTATPTSTTIAPATTTSTVAADFTTTEAPATSTTTGAPQTSTTTALPEPESEVISFVADAGLVASSTTTTSTEPPIATSTVPSPTTTAADVAANEARAYADAVQMLESKPIAGAMKLNAPTDSGSTTNLALAGAVVLGFVGLGAVLVLKP